MSCWELRHMSLILGVWYFTAKLLKICVFCCVTLCHSACSCQHFKGLKCLHYQGHTVHKECMVLGLLYFDEGTSQKTWNLNPGYIPKTICKTAPLRLICNWNWTIVGLGHKLIIMMCGTDGNKILCVFNTFFCVYVVAIHWRPQCLFVVIVLCADNMTSDGSLK